MNTTETTATPTNVTAGAQVANATSGTVTAKKAATRKKNAPKAKQGVNKAKPKKTGNAPKKATASKSEPREGSKKQIVIEMLGCKTGSTMAEIAKETDWQNHSIRGFVSIIGKKS